MKLVIEIDTSNAAFDEFAGDELDQIFSQCIRSVELWEHCDIILDHEAVLFDSNGNRCGWIRGGVE